jgi:hypothetical protein
VEEEGVEEGSLAVHKRFLDEVRVSKYRSGPSQSSLQPTEAPLTRRPDLIPQSRSMEQDCFAASERSRAALRDVR